MRRLLHCDIALHHDPGRLSPRRYAMSNGASMCAIERLLTDANLMVTRRARELFDERQA